MTDDKRVVRGGECGTPELDEVIRATNIDLKNIPPFIRILRRKC